MRSVFYNVAGLDYIEHAFKAARKASSTVKLYYNDYNMCTEGQKLRAVVNMLTKLIKDGTPIDGVGIQSHFKSPTASYASKARAAIETIVKTGEYMNNPLDIQITELDTENYSNNDTALSSFYSELFETYRDLSDYISNVTFWGVADDYSWLDHGQYSMAHPFLFDGNQEAKPAFYAVFNF